MEVVRFIVGGILPYVAIVVFVTGMAYRIYTWKRAPSPAMTLFPSAETSGSNVVNTLKEATLFTSLFRGDRVLWGFAWAFHIVLALIFMGHLRVFTNVDSALMRAGMSEAAIQFMSSSAGGAAGVLVVITALFLLVRRLVVKRVREITGFGDYFALLLIGAILITGNVMRFGAEHFDLNLARDYFASIATFKGVSQAAVLDSNMFVIHMGLALLLMICIPFSKILHFGGIFFTHQLIRKP